VHIAHGPVKLLSAALITGQVFPVKVEHIDKKILVAALGAVVAAETETLQTAFLSVCLHAHGLAFCQVVDGELLAAMLACTLHRLAPFRIEQ